MLCGGTRRVRRAHLGGVASACVRCVCAVARDGELVVCGRKDFGQPSECPGGVGRALGCAHHAATLMSHACAPGLRARTMARCS